MKYSIEEIEEMLLEPSFDLEMTDYGLYNHIKQNDIQGFLELVEEAIRHHEKLNKSNNGEGF